MASITKRGNRWLAQVRRKGFEPFTKAFTSKAEAEAWARQTETKIDVGLTRPAASLALKTTSLGAVLDRYLDEITPHKRSADTERLRLKKLRKAPVCDLALADLSGVHLAAYRDERLAMVKPGTIRRELSLIHHALDLAVKEWGLPPFPNPVKTISLPPLRNARDRRLGHNDALRLKAALAACRNRLVPAVVYLAIETGLRRQEVLGLTWDAIDLDRRTAFIPVTKTGQARTVPLTDDALAVLATIEPTGASLFPFSTNAFKLAWKRVQSRAGLTDLRFHDLRHEALSRFCELGLTIPELAVISGHRDPRMLFRYAHLSADRLASKLRGKSWSLSVERS